MSTRNAILMSLTAALLALPTSALAKKSPRPEDLSTEAIAARRENLRTDIRALTAEARRADWLGNRVAAYEKLRVVEWLLGADVVQLGAEKVASKLDCDESTARNVGRGAGLLTSVGVGAAVGGPVGAAVGAGAWAIGEAIGSLFD